MCCGCNSPVGFSDVQSAWLCRAHFSHTSQHYGVRWGLLRMRKARGCSSAAHVRYQQRYVTIFTALRYASVGYAVIVCLPIRLSVIRRSSAKTAKT